MRVRRLLALGLALVLSGGCHEIWPLGSVLARDGAVDAPVQPDADARPDAPVGRDHRPDDQRVPVTVTTLWARTMGSSSADAFNAVAVDGQGSAHVAGYFGAGIATSLPSELTAPEHQGGKDVLVVAHASDTGNPVWIAGLGGEHDDEGSAIAVDPDGTTWVAGQVMGPEVHSCNGTLLDVDPAGDSFLASWGSGGDCGSFGASSLTGADACRAIADAGPGVLWGTGFVTSSGKQQICVGRNLDVSPTTFSPGGVAHSGHGIALDDKGNVYVTGTFSGTLTLGGERALTGAGETDIFVASFDANRTHRWSTSFGGTGADQGSSVAVDAQGSVYIAGDFTGPLDFGGTTLNGTGATDIFVAKLDPAGGTVRWAKGFGSKDADHARSLAVDSAGNVYLAGEFSGAIDLGGGPLTSAGAADILVASFDTEGAHRWSRSFGGTGLDGARGVAVTERDDQGPPDVYVCGSFTGPVDFGDDPTHVYSDDIDAFLLKLGQQETPAGGE